MWNSNGFHSHGNFQQGQGIYQQGYEDDSYISPSPNQQYFQQRSSQEVNYNSPVGGSHEFMTGQFHPEIGLYNDGTFAYNQFQSFEGPEQYIPQPSSTVLFGNSRPNLTARAVELKAQLLRNKERARSGTPPVTTGNSAPGPNTHAEAASSFRYSPRTPKSPSSGAKTSSRRPSGVIDDDISELISEVQAAATVKESTQKEPSAIKPTQSARDEPKVKVKLPATESTTKDKKSDADNKATQPKTLMNRIAKTEGKVESSDGSEGEIFEDIEKKTPRLPTDTKEIENTGRGNRGIEPSSRRAHNEKSEKELQRKENLELHQRQENSMSNTRARPSRLHDERRVDGDRKAEMKGHQDDIYERKYQPREEPKKSAHYQSRDPAEKYLKHTTNQESRVEEIESGKPDPPKLAELLLMDEDLKDWLEVTGYHNTEYRNKILNRRRAIAALDAQKAKLLEEMEIEERGGVPPTTNTQTPPVGMLPPLISSKIGASSSKKVEELPVRKSDETAAPTKPKNEIGTKRTYTTYQESRDEEVGENVRIAEERGRRTKIKNESHDETRIPSSRRSPPARRRSPSPSDTLFRNEDRDSSRKSLSRNEDRASVRQLDRSPSLDSLDIKRSKTREHTSADYPQGSPEYKKGQLVHVGNYRGRAYNPNHKSRGRGRATWIGSSETRFEQPLQQVKSFGYHVAAMKPFKDPKPLDLGGRGDTRYFIVKSFNEENVVRCREDSIWTTQVENGDIFKKAFLTCKNVILVFSVNHSRAFQGYARMENTPGSETRPAWQNNIHWESAGAFKVRWLCVSNTHFQLVGHLKNRLNEYQAVLVGRDGQEIEENAGKELIKILDEEASRLLDRNYKISTPTLWD